MTSSVPRPPFSSRPPQPPAGMPGTAPEPEGGPSFDLRQIMAAARRRWWLIALVGLTTSAVMSVRVLNQAPVYRGGFRLLVEPTSSSPGLEVSTSLSDGGNRKGGLDYDTQIQVLRSSQVMLPILQELRKQHPGISYGRLQRGLEIERLGKTKILSVTYKDTDPARAGNVLAAVANGYVEYSETTQLASQQRGTELIEEQLPQIRDRVAAIQERLQRFREEHNIIDPETLGNQLTGNISELQQQQRSARIGIVENRSMLVNLQEQLGLELDEAITTVALSQSSRYQTLLGEIQELETDLALERTRFTAASPNIRVLEERRATLENLLQAEARALLDTSSIAPSIQERLASPNPLQLQLTQQLVDTTNQIVVLGVRIEALAAAEAQLRDSIEEIAELSREYRNIQIELSVATDSLNRLLALRETLQLEAVRQAVPWQLLEPPRPPGAPESSNVRQGLLLAAAAGVVAGIGAAFAAEKLDSKFHSAEAIKEATKLPLLGAIPFQDGLQQRLSAEQTGDTGLLSSSSSDNYRSFSFLEAFRSLHANLSFASPDKPVKSLVVSSAIPTEGKTTIAIYLAQVAATMGQKVLLVDADLRRPQLHQKLELPNRWGLSNVISTGLNLDDAIQRSPRYDNLYVLTSGPTPPDPLRLVSSQAMEQLVREWEQAFGLVIFDSPPLGGLADAKLLANHTGGLLMAIGLGVVEKGHLREVFEGLRMARATVLGTVANGVRRHSSEAFYYNYYYRYYLAGQSDREDPVSPNGTGPGSGTGTLS